MEIASIMKYIIEKANNPTPYYYNVPEGFIVPAVFFPKPEIDTRGETFNSYAMSYIWNVKFFDKTKQGEYDMAFAVLKAIKDDRNLIPIIDAQGIETNKFARLSDPKLTEIDDGPIQIEIGFDSIQPN